MKELTPRTLYVSDATNAQYHSITQATEDAGEGDKIIVSSGIYSSKFSNDKEKEKFPIYLPPNCQLIGSGADSCKIDGGGDMRTSARPVNPFECLVLLGDGASISGFTVCNSGANGISNEQGAVITMSNNIVRDNGQHGLLIFGTNNAVIKNNQFVNNGTKEEKYKPPRSSIPGKQGHHIFIESRIDSKNIINITENILDKTFADGIAIDIFDQPEGAKMNLKVNKNEISNCGRNGFSMAGSYGPSNSKVKIEIKNNKIVKTYKSAIDLQSAFSLILKSIENSDMSIDIVGNEIQHGNIGIDAYGAFSPSKNCHLKCNIIGNNITKIDEYGIRAIGGFGMDNWPVSNSRFDAKIEENIVLETKDIPILIQGGDVYKSDPKLVTNNELFVKLSGNQIDESKKIIVKDGISTNHVHVLKGSQQHVRK